MRLARVASNREHLMARADQDSNLFLSFGDLLDGNEQGPRNDVPIVDLTSDDPLELPEVVEREPAADFDSLTPMPPGGVGRGQIWLNGDVLMCACPDCRAPMSIRFWLMIADCWKCAASIELSEEQEREARRLMGERPAPTSTPQQYPTAHQQRPGSEAVSASSATSERSPREKRPHASVPPAAPTPTINRDASDTPAAPQRPARVPTRRPGGQSPPRTAAQNRLRARLERSAKATGVTALLYDLFGCTPAWLVSLILHIVLLTLLALFGTGREDEGPYITLSTAVAKDVNEYGDTIVADPLNEVNFDLPVPKDVDLTDPKQREAVVRDNQDARELRVDPNDPTLPDITKVKRLVGTSTGGGAALAARDPRIRTEVVKREGGTTLTEAAVARGLRWMTKHQNRDGSWSLDGFNRSGGCTCTGTGTRSDSAGTSLALLAYLGAGQTHLVGRYRETVSSGLRWLIDAQREDGDLRGNATGNTGMYSHGQATIVLCEAYLMTGDEELRHPAQRALDFIVDAQHPAGGWRYRPKEAGDTSVVGWQVMALQSGRAAKLEVDPIALELASHYLDAASSRGGALYAYQPGHRPTHIMTAEGLLCRMYLGWKADTPGLREGVSYLLGEHLPDQNQPNIYYWYYGTQTLHHYGGSQWKQWNDRMRDILVNTQEKRGHAAGSWAPRGPHASAGGRLYMTALATCSLEVYYRHLPIFRQIDLD